MGENYESEEEVLIKPTYLLCEMLKDEGVSATFFADVLCPIRYRELHQFDFPEMFDNQLCEMSRYGHDVQLHVHPHWLKATEVGRFVKFDRTFYRIHNWQNDNGEKASIKQIIHQGKEYLERVMHFVDNDYKCIAFRAGGYCLQPECLLAPILSDEGILIDSSVCRGFSYDGDGMYYNYSDMPKVYNSFFSKDVGLCDALTIRPTAERGIFEVPCWGFKAFPQRIIASKKNKKISDAKPKGSGMSITPSKPLGFWERVHSVFSAYNMLTFDFYNAESMVYMIKSIAERRDCQNKDVYISIISHPKIQSLDHISNMRSALTQIKMIPNIRLLNMRQIVELEGL